MACIGVNELPVEFLEQLVLTTDFGIS